MFSGRRLKSVAHGQEGNKRLEGIRRWWKKKGSCNVAAEGLKKKYTCKGLRDERRR
jgi:hypothetical protein